MDITILVKQVYWYISRVSGERLQDHWSSGINPANRTPGVHRAPPRGGGGGGGGGGGCHG